MTKGEIDRIGKKIREESSEIKSETLNHLEELRKSFKAPLSEIFKSICLLRFKVNRDVIVTYRIKRIESIINKLKRYPEMRLSRMWDIGGCRIIVKNNKEVYEIRDIIASKFIIHKVNDYIKKPHEDGYKSLHLYVSANENGEIIEIQIRNIEDHNWSTLVEISDLLFDAGLKEYSRDKNLLEFHKLLSIVDETDFFQAKRIIDIEKSYKYFENMSNVFAKNYLDVREQWLEIEHKSSYKYFLIEAKKDEVPKILAFDNFQDAEDTYFEKYKTTENKNIILTHLPKPAFNQISIAYSNYILSMHDFEYKILNILEKVIFEYLKNERFWKFYFYYSYYQKIKLGKLKSYLNELERSYLILGSKPDSRKKKLRKKYEEWKKDIRIDINNHISQDKKFILEFRKIYPGSPALTKFVVKTVIRYKSWRNLKLINQEIKKLKKL